MPVARLQEIEAWLDTLQLPPVSEEEAVWLCQPYSRKTRCQVYDDLIWLCSLRYQNSGFWPDFAPLNLNCRSKKSRLKVSPRIFCIGF